MRPLLLAATAMLATPALAAARSQCAVSQGAEAFIQLPPPVDVTGRPVSLPPKPAPLAADTSPHLEGTISDNPSTSAGQPSVELRGLSDSLSAVPVLQHIAEAGANLTELGALHGVRTVAARHGTEFMIFQVVPDGQVAVAGLLTDLTVDQLKAVSGSALTELETQHGLRSFFLRSGARFQVFYATPDGQRVIPGVMWDAAGQDLTRKAIAAIPGAIPTVTVGAAAAGSRVTPAIATSETPGPGQFANATFGVAGNDAAPTLEMFVDPQCSFSIRAMQALQPFVESGKVRLHLIPLSILDGEDNGLSTQHALGLVSTPPDQMLAAWETGRYSDSSDADAAPKLAANMAAAAANQVRGTPTFFWRKRDGSEGRFDGVPNNMGALIAALGS